MNKVFWSLLILEMNSTLNHLFLIAILEKIGFGTEFIECLKVLLNNQE